MAAADATAAPRKQASDQAYHVFGDWPRRVDFGDGRKAEGTHFGVRGFGGIGRSDGARLTGTRAPRLMGYVVTRAARRRRMRSRRKWVTLAVTMTSVTAIDRAMGSHGVSSDGLGERGSVSGSGSP
jgi:hypothetical protein